MKDNRREELHRKFAEMLDSADRKAAKSLRGVERLIGELGQELEREVLEATAEGHGEHHKQPPGECPECGGHSLRPLKETAPQTEGGEKK